MSLFLPGWPLPLPLRFHCQACHAGTGIQVLTGGGEGAVGALFESSHEDNAATALSFRLNLAVLYYPSVLPAFKMLFSLSITVDTRCHVSVMCAHVLRQSLVPFCRWLGSQPPAAQAALAASGGLSPSCPTDTVPEHPLWTWPGGCARAQPSAGVRAWAWAAPQATSCPPRAPHRRTPSGAPDRTACGCGRLLC